MLFNCSLPRIIAGHAAHVPLIPIWVDFKLWNPIYFAIHKPLRRRVFECVHKICAKVGGSCVICCSYRVAVNLRRNNNVTSAGQRFTPLRKLWMENAFNHAR